MAELTNDFSINIFRLREERKMSQSKLAEILGTSQCNVCAWEHKAIKPSFTMIFKLCDLFETNPTDLMGYERKTKC